MGTKCDVWVQKAGPCEGPSGSGLDRSETAEQLRQGVFRPLATFSMFTSETFLKPDSAVVHPVQVATLRRLFLIDLLFVAYAADGAAKPDANIELH